MDIEISMDLAKTGSGAMIALLVDFKIKDGAMDDFMPLMLKQSENSVRLEDGCLQFDVCTDPDAPLSVFLYEVYEDRAAVDLHMETAHFKSFDAEVADLIAEKSVRVMADVFQPTP
jgi:quinol monooxygenase YgiN